MVKVEVVGREIPIRMHATLEAVGCVVRCHTQ